MLQWNFINLPVSMLLLSCCLLSFFSVTSHAIEWQLVDNLCTKAEGNICTAQQHKKGQLISSILLIRQRLRSCFLRKEKLEFDPSSPFSLSRGHFSLRVTFPIHRTRSRPRGNALDAFLLIKSSESRAIHIIARRLFVAD